LLETAIEQQADLVLVHHGYFWRGETSAITGMRRNRIKTLLQQDISLLAYHLPLDAHPELGNNITLANRLGFEVMEPLNPEGIGLTGRTARPVSVKALALQIEQALGRTPQVIPAGPAEIRRVGWCTGAAQDYIEQAIALGLDAYISGEISERTVHVAREAGIHYFAAGHHATERYGVQALGEELAREFTLEHRFVDIDNPV
jgi:dinuclear metal center YbgI/SA1388 family protein